MQRFAIHFLFFTCFVFGSQWARSADVVVAAPPIDSSICMNESMPGVDAAMVALGKAYEDIYMDSLLNLFRREGVNLKREQVPQGRYVRDKSEMVVEWKDYSHISFIAGGQSWNLFVSVYSFALAFYRFYKPALRTDFSSRYNALGVHIGYKCRFGLRYLYPKGEDTIQVEIYNSDTNRSILRGERVKIPAAIASYPGFEVRLDLNGNIVGVSEPQSD